MAGYTIIHLSDLHVGRWESDESNVLLADFTAERLADDLREISTRYSISFRPEETLLIITGDITHQNKWEEYEIAAHFINKLKSHFAQYLQIGEFPAEHVICIPGNHDIEIAETPPTNTATLRKTKYRNFKLFLDDITDHSAFANNFTLAAPFINVNISVPFRLHILDLGTTLNVNCFSKDDISSKGCLTASQLEYLKTSLNHQEDVFRIALMHHPLTDFPAEGGDHSVSYSDLVKWLVENNFRVVLCGHTHSADAKTIIPILEEGSVLELGTGFSHLQGKLNERGNHYQIIRIDPSSEHLISLLRRKFVYARTGERLDRNSGHWESEDLDHAVIKPKIPNLDEINPTIDYKNYLGIGNSRDWTVIAHCESNKFQQYGVLSPGETVNANLLKISEYLEGHLERVQASFDAEWEKFSGKTALFLVDSPHYNPYVRYVLRNYGTHLAGGVVRFVDLSAEKPPLRRIQVYGTEFIASKNENMRLFDEFNDYVLIMRLPSFVPRTGDATVEMSDIDKNRVIWIVAGIHSKASNAGAMLFTPRNLQLMCSSLQSHCGGTIPEYFEAVYKTPTKPARIEHYDDLELVHFKKLRLKSEVGLADDLPSGVSARFLDRNRWNTIPINTVHLDPVAGCNFNCPDCIEKELREKRLYLSFSTCADILCDLKEVGCQNLSFYGGEPTLHPDFDTILRLASNIGFDMLLVTNGSRLGDPKIKKAIIDARKRIHLRVSIDSHSEEFHQKNHGIPEGKKHIKGIRHNVEQLIKQGVSVTVSFLLHKESIHELEEACKFWEEKHAAAFVLRPLTQQQGISPQLEYEEHELELIREIIDKHKHSGFVFTQDWFHKWINGSGEYREQDKKYDSCYSGYYRIAISPDTAKADSPEIKVNGLTLTETSKAWISFCTYRRCDEKFGMKYPSDLKVWCQTERLEVLDQIDPSRHCEGIVCCRHAYNEQIRNLISSTRAF